MRVIGKTFAGAINSVGPISTGTITSEPGFGEVPLNGTFVHGADVIRICPTGKVAVLDFRSVIEYVVPEAFSKCPGTH